MQKSIISIEVLDHFRCLFISEGFAKCFGSDEMENYTHIVRSPPPQGGQESSISITVVSQSSSSQQMFLGKLNVKHGKNDFHPPPLSLVVAVSEAAVETMKYGISSLLYVSQCSTSIQLV